MGIYIYTWAAINQEESMLGVSSEYTEDFNCGLIWVIKSKTQDQSGRNHSWRLPMLPVSLLKRSVSNVNSQTPVSESVSEFSSKRITRESPLTFQGTVV